MSAQPKSPQVVRQEMSGKGSTSPLSTTASTLAAGFFARNWQVGGAVQITTPVIVAGLGAGATETVTANVALSGNLPAPNSSMPSSIALGAGQSAVMLISVFVSAVSGAASTSPFFGLPLVRLTFTGSSGATLVGGTLFTLQGAATFSNPVAIVSLPVYAPAAFSSTTVNLVVEAVLFGIAS